MLYVSLRIIEHMKKGVSVGKGKASGSHEEKFSGSKMEVMAKTLPFLAIPNDEKKDVVRAEDKVGSIVLYSSRSISDNFNL